MCEAGCGGGVIHVRVYVCGGQRLMWRSKIDARGLPQSVSTLYSGKGFLTWTQTSLTWVVCLGNILQGSPRLRLHCAEIVDGPPCPIGGNWGSQVQCLYSHHARSHLPSPLQTVKHSLLLLVVTCLLSCSASSWASFGQECLPLAQCFSHFWLIGIQSHFPLPLSLMSALPSFSFYVLGLHPYFSHHCSWLVNIYKTVSFYLSVTTCFYIQYFYHISNLTNCRKELWKYSLSQFKLRCFLLTLFYFLLAHKSTLHIFLYPQIHAFVHLLPVIFSFSFSISVCVRVL